MTDPQVRLSRRAVLATGAAALAATALPAARADSRTIRLLVGFPAGGGTDAIARLLAERLREVLGQPVIVENKPGAGGNIGSDYVAKAAPDGQVIGLAAVATHAINPWLFSKMPFDAAKDFAPITQMVRVPNVLVMNADTAARLGGDEFVLLLGGLHHPRECEDTARRVLHAVALPIEVEGHTVHVSASMGISVFPRDGCEAEQLLRQADQAMYQAKQRGRNRYVLYAPAMAEAAPGRV